MPVRPAVALRPLLEVLERVLLGAELGRLVPPVVDVLVLDVLLVDVLLVEVLVGVPIEEVGLDRVAVDDVVVGVVLGCVAGAAMLVSAAVVVVVRAAVVAVVVGAAVVVAAVVGAAVVGALVVAVVVGAGVVAVVVGAGVFAVSVGDMVRCAVAAAVGTGRALGDVVIGVMGSNVRPALPATATLDPSPGTVTTTPAEGRDADVTTDVTRAVAEPAAGFDGA